MTGSGTDSCTVFLNAAAGSGGLNVNLSSSDPAVTLPATVTVPANATSAPFSATVASVNTAQTATLTATAGTVSKTAMISLSGAGSFQVNLTWDAPADSSAPAVAGYYIFRAIAGSSMYQQLNPQGDFEAQTMYTDTTVASGTTYDYYVESVDSNGVESAPSSITSVPVP
jgi:fibronectin type 3 domain-containing protein